MQEEVAEPAAREDADHSGRADGEEHERAERLSNSVLLRHELDAEGLDARQEEVAAGARQDECDVRLDREDITRGVEQSQPAGILREDELGIGLDAAFAGKALRVRRLLLAVVAGSGRDRLRVAETRGFPAAGRLAQREHEPRQRERRQGEDHERRAPGQRRDSTGHRESEGGADELAREDVAVDASPLGRVEPVADERCDDRPGRRRDDAEEEACKQQLPECRRGGAPEHCDAPEHDRAAEQSCPLKAVGEDAEGNARQCGNE